ncbi:hypothetical protein Slin15195_G117780 [Septoria linicola]|uniref:Uncharacterized protein n=1 Tax=Septoria linicola TaxID=215465 RepID=A0A9Q9AZY4_9PEZI|nr:hypothetical protein Slin15195_G117780 [Septoria linicola]
MRSSLPLLTLLPLTLAQNVTVPSTCEGNFTAGTNEVLYTLPYSYDQVLSIIGNYSNLTWAGVPELAKLNGTDNEVGTARTWSLMGLTAIETILSISIPPSPGPYYEVHNTALGTIPDPTDPSTNISFYIPQDYTTVTSLCSGKASQLNYTAEFCATNVPVANGLLGQIHESWGPMIGQLLGGMNYTSCEDLGSDEVGPVNATSPVEGAAGNGTASTAGGETSAGGSAMPSPTMGNGAVERASVFGSVVAMAAGVVMM